MSRSSTSYHQINHVTISKDKELDVLNLELWHDKEDAVPCHRVSIFGTDEAPIIKLVVS